MSDHPSGQKIFYGRAYIYFILAALVIVFAFSPSYFQKLKVTDSAHHFHGITASLWMLLLIIQPLLYRNDLMKGHRMIGRLSLLLVPLIVISALNMVYIMMVRKVDYPPNVPYQLAYIDFFTLLLFILFYVLAVANRKDIQYHARYMVCTVMGPLIPALTRLLFIFPFVKSFNMSLNISYIIIEVVLLLLLIDDKRRGMVRLPYILALVLFAIQHLTMNYASEWEWWRSLMDKFAG